MREIINDKEKMWKEETERKRGREGKAKDREVMSDREWVWEKETQRYG